MSIFYNLISKEPFKLNQSNLRSFILKDAELYDKQEKRVGQVFEPEKLEEREQKLFNYQYNYSTDTQSLIESPEQEEMFYNEFINIARENQLIFCCLEHEEVIYPQTYQLNKTTSARLRELKTIIKANRVAIIFILLIILSPLSIRILKQMAPDSPNSVYLLVGFTPILLALLLMAYYILRIRRYLRFGFKDNEKEWTEMVSAVSSFLLDDTGVDIPTPFKQYLKQDELDYSLESLKIVDDYLEQVRRRKKELKEQEYDKVILRCGAYCGEVMRRLPAGKNCQWITEEEATKKDPSIQNFAQPVLTTFILYDYERKSFTFPMAKAAKFLESGPGDSLYFYAKAIIAGVSKKAV